VDIIKKIIKKYESKTPELNELVKDVSQIKISIEDIKKYMSEVPNTFQGNYYRNKIGTSQIGALIMTWFKGSDIHIHDDSAVIYVLSGSLINIKYTLSNKSLLVKDITIAQPGEMIFEEKGLIHQIIPARIHNDPCLSAHFYFPPKQNLEGTKIIDPSCRRIITLSSNAKEACIPSNTEEILKVQENVFNKTNFSIFKYLFQEQEIASTPLTRQ
jgi:quercetin dioxygenase-like cupin family protein